MTETTNVAIASESPYTVDAGRQLAEMGGNAVDIALGCALAATVSEALMCSLGGSAFINIKLPGEDPELIDGADVMPHIPEADLNSGEKAWKAANIPYGDGITINVGHASVAVPGMLRALELAWQRHGSLTWREILVPAIALAKYGTTANQTLVSWLGMAGHAVFFEQRESRETFFPDGVTPLQHGEFYKPPHLDSSLELIAREGADALYRGDLGKAFSEEITGNNGYVTMDDLAAYQAQVRKPIVLASHGYRLALNPPPAIGGAMVGSMVRMYDALWSGGMSGAERTLAIARIQRTMFSLRHQEGSADWSDERAAMILEKPWIERFYHKTFSPNTMHVSVATGDGTVVAITMSNGYGSGISIPGTGIPTNNSLGEPELNPAGYFRIPPWRPAGVEHVPYRGMERQRHGPGHGITRSQPHHHYHTAGLDTARFREHELRRHGARAAAARGEHRRRLCSAVRTGHRCEPVRRALQAARLRGARYVLRGAECRGQ